MDFSQNSQEFYQMRSHPCVISRKHKIIKKKLKCFSQSSRKPSLQGSSLHENLFLRIFETVLKMPQNKTGYY